MSTPDFTTFVAGEGPRLLRFATLLTGSVPEAEDLVQTALTSMYSRWSRVGGDDPATYARRCIANARVSAWRRVRRTFPVAESPDSVMPDAYLASDDRASLVAALATLSRPQRLVVLLHDLEGWDLVEIAARLDMPAATVRSHHSRGLARLREQLSETSTTSGSAS